MGKKLAITTVFHFQQSSMLKKLLLFFDKVYLLDSEIETRKLEIEYYGNTHKEFAASIASSLDEFNYLLDIGLVDMFSEPDLVNESIKNYPEKEFSQFIESIKIHSRLNKKSMDEMTDEEAKSFIDITNDVATRYGHIALHQSNVQNVIPIFHTQRVYETSNVKQDVLYFTFNKLPVPENNTPWEQIIDFRNDSDVQSSYLALINWINRTAKTNITLDEVEDEFNVLYDDYIKHYNLHKMKSQMTTLDIIVSTGIDALTNLDSVGQYIKALFALRKSKISLMEEEMKLPGHEIAYIYKANEAFRNA
jgi:hypothetical protein